MTEEIKKLIIYTRKMKKREPLYRDYPEEFREEIRGYLESNHISRLYAHQVEMFEKVRAGERRLPFCSRYCRKFWKTRWHVRFLFTRPRHWQVTSTARCSRFWNFSEREEFQQAYTMEIPNLPSGQGSARVQILSWPIRRCWTRHSFRITAITGLTRFLQIYDM